MDQKELSYAEIMQIVEMFKASPELSHFHLKYGVTELDLRKPGAEAAPVAKASPPAAIAAPGPATAPARVVEAPRAVEPTSTSASAKSFVIKSISVGTFYCTPRAGATPFVSVGQRINSDTTVCIIEVMKLMNAMQAGCSGIVKEILVRDAQSVEYDQPLMVVEID